MKLLLAIIAIAAAGIIPAAASAEDAKPFPVAAEAKWFPEEKHAGRTIAAAVALASASKRYAVIVFGADWCHDSRALARTLTSPLFASQFGSRFSVTFIDVGKPQTGAGHNLDSVAALGLKDLKSTPAMFVLGSEGKPLNKSKDALSWRNAETRGQDKILAWFANFVKKHPTA